MSGRDTAPVHFIADLHLLDDNDPNAARLAGYLSGPARAASALYILGDLFEVWVGDDGSSARHAQTLSCIRELVDAGAPVYFQRGNRDFAVGAEFVARTGIQILDDPCRLDLCGIPTLITHGDLLCTDDTAHQRFRARYGDPRWRARMLALPLWLRRLAAALARRRSRAGKTRKPAHIMNVNPETVAELITSRQVLRMIHGHTHRPRDHKESSQSAQWTRHVVADWRADQAEVLVVDADGVQRRTLDRRGRFTSPVQGDV